MQLAILHVSWFSRRLSRWGYGILTGLVISGVSVHTAPAFDSAGMKLAGKIIFHDEQLTTNVTATSLQQVMKEISKVSGVQIRWLDAEGEEPVSVNFAARPFSEAIQYLLEERNFLLFYSTTGEGARVTQVWISSKKMRTKQLEDAHQSLAQESPFPNEEHAPEEDFAPPDMLLQTALYGHDSVVRRKAITRLEEYSPQDPRISAALAHLADSDADPQIRETAVTILEALE